MSAIKRLFNNHENFIIGMVHLKALPGSPSFNGSMNDVINRAVSDATALKEGGVNAIMVENFFDIPFTRGRVAAETVSAMTVAIHEVNKATSLPIGVNVLRNDGLSAIAIAKATAACFIRVNVLASARLTDQGIIEGIAYELTRLRKAIYGEDIAILADLDVKHSSPLAPFSVELEAEELVGRSGASALIITGATTGRGADSKLASEVSLNCNVPVIIGSGINKDNIKLYTDLNIRNFIVGTSLKTDGKIENPVDVNKVRELTGILS
jgi:hypothetical protein